MTFSFCRCSFDSDKLYHPCPRFETALGGITCHSCSPGCGSLLAWAAIDALSPVRGDTFSRFGVPVLRTFESIKLGAIASPTPYGTGLLPFGPLGPGQRHDWFGWHWHFASALFLKGAG